MSVEVVQKDMGELLEGPHWDDVTNTLLYVDFECKVVHRYNPATKEAKKVKVHDQLGAVVTTTSGRTLVIVGQEFGFVDWETGKYETLLEVDMREGTGWNDGKCDPAGRFWADLANVTGNHAWCWYQPNDAIPPNSWEIQSTMGAMESLNDIEKGKGSLFCLHSNLKVTKHVDDVDISNGMAWTADRKTLYYIDTLRHGVDAFDYNNQTAEIGNRRQVVKVPDAEGLPDGMCIDSEDMLWVALFSGDVINRYNPKTGEKLQTIRFPTTNITSCCWGGPNCDELYVTSAKHFLTDEQKKTQPLAGSVFRVTGLGVKGVKCEPFNDS